MNKMDIVQINCENLDKLSLSVFNDDYEQWIIVVPTQTFIMKKADKYEDETVIQRYNDKIAAIKKTMRELNYSIYDRIDLAISRRELSFIKNREK